MNFKFNPFYLFYNPTKITRREKWITLIALIWVFYQGFKFVFNLLNIFIFSRICSYWAETLFMSKEEMAEKGYVIDGVYGFTSIIGVISFLALLCIAVIMVYFLFTGWRNHIIYSDEDMKLSYREFNKLYKASPDRWVFSCCNFLKIWFEEDNRNRIYINLSFVPYWIIYFKEKTLINSKDIKRKNNEYFKKYSIILETTQKDIQKKIQENKVNSDRL